MSKLKEKFKEICTTDFKSCIYSIVLGLALILMGVTLYCLLQSTEQQKISGTLFTLFINSLGAIQWFAGLDKCRDKCSAGVALVTLLVSVVAALGVCKIADLIAKAILSIA
jgi:hypothetical protein